MYPILSLRHWATFHTLVVLFALWVYVAVSVARRQRRHPSAALGWVIALALLPYVALPLFVVFGTRKTGRAMAARRRAPLAPPATAAAPTTGKLQALAWGLGLPTPAGYHGLRIHEDGGASLQCLHELLRGARRTIDVSTFLLGRDEVGAALCELLVRRAAEGVRVRLIVDGVGRYLGGRPPLDAFRQAGVTVALFVPPLSSRAPGRVNLRNHRKLALADGQWLWTGGRNLAAEYFCGKPLRQGRPAAPWTDLSFDLRGEIAGRAQEQFDRDWSTASGAPAPAAHEAGAACAFRDDAAQLVPSGPDQAEDTVYALLIEACFAAQGRIVAITPYFVPDQTLLMAFALAARRGVTVDLVLPRRSNHLLADMARPAAVREMVDSGVRVWLAPAMVHAKLIIVDDALALAGSVNLDERSLFLNYEMMIAFYRQADIARFAAWAERVRGTATMLTPRPVSVLREFAEGLLRWLTFQL